MATSNTYHSIHTAHYSAYLVLLVILSTSSTSRAASIGLASPPSVTNCSCTTQPSSDFQTIISPKIDITASTRTIKEFPPGVNTILTPPTSVPQKLTFTLRKKIKMTDQMKSDDEVVLKEVAPIQIDAPKEGQPGKQRSDHQDKKESPEDNIVFPKDDETVTPTSEMSKTTMQVGNRILIGGMPNDGYGRDANGEIVELFQ